MNLWDDDDDDDLQADEGMNPYLADEHKGLALIARLLSQDKKNSNKQKNIRRLDYLLDRKLLEMSGKVALSNEIELQDRLIQLSDKLFEQHKLKLLKNKTVIGIGGKFSAGKSKFINAILGSDMLPEDQSPTTSIPTYLVRKSHEAVHAYTYNDQNIPLDMEAAQALTHAFYQKYNIGFSQFINNLVMNVPDFAYDNIAILDTPGYNKADSSVKRSVSDAEKAFHQLKTVDYMIWLVDVENGVIQQPDLDFIRSVKAKNPILVVFNKADKKTASAVELTLEQSREILKRSGLPIYNVIAYSSLNREEFGGTNWLEEFLNRANRDVNRNEDMVRQIKEIHRNITKQLAAERTQRIDRRNEIGHVIFQSENVMEIQTLVKLYSEVIRDIRHIDDYTNAVETVQKDINKLLITIFN